MDGASKEEAEDSTFTNIPLADDTGKGEPDDLQTLKFSNCSAVLQRDTFYYNDKTYSL